MKEKEFRTCVRRNSKKGEGEYYIVEKEMSLEIINEMVEIAKQLNVNDLEFALCIMKKLLKTKKD